MHASAVLRLALCLGLAVSLGCSISESISKSISSPFESSSASSGGGESAYQSDVRDYTVAYVKSSQDVASFQQGIAGVAAKHGVTNWQANPATYRGIGEGLGKANVTDTQLEVYKSNLASGNPAMAAEIQKGYDATHGD